MTFNPWVEISPEKITLIAQHADIGQGVGSVQPIMIAEEMDLDPGQFEVRFAGPSPPISTPASRTRSRRSWRRTKVRPPRKRAPMRSNG